MGAGVRLSWAVLQVSECGWAARRAPSLRSLYSLCRDMHWWLRQDHKNVCVLHCTVSAAAGAGPCPSLSRGRGRWAGACPWQGLGAQQ